MKVPDCPEPRLTIPDWCEQDRPREKFAAQGASTLSNAELIAILLRTGTASENALELSKRLLHTCNNKLNQLADISLQNLTRIKGIGKAKAITLKSAFEIGKRLRAEEIGSRTRITSSNDVANLMLTRNAYLRHEEFWVVALNHAAEVLDVCQIGKGGITSTFVDVRLILQEAILHDATALILCHNHPSGSLKPSTADIKLTKQIRDAAELFDIKVIDHIIVHKNVHLSFKEEGLL